MFTVQRVGVGAVSYVPGAIRARNISATAPITKVAGKGHTDTAIDSAMGHAVSAYLQSERRNTPRRRIILASDLMSSPVFTVPDDTTIDGAWEVLTAHRFRHLMVASSAGKLVGIVSDRDILKRARGRASHELGKELIRSFMVTEVLTATPDTEIREIARVLFEERIGCMPISSEDGFVVGVITRSDLLRSLLVQAPLELWL
jgi:acetoin utilization protein AcuB